MILKVAVVLTIVKVGILSNLDNFSAEKKRKKRIVVEEEEEEDDIIVEEDYFMDENKCSE